MADGRLAVRGDIAAICPFSDWQYQMGLWLTGLMLHYFSAIILFPGTAGFFFRDLRNFPGGFRFPGPVLPLTVSFGIRL